MPNVCLKLVAACIAVFCFHGQAWSQTGCSVDEFAACNKSETAKWGKVIRDSGAKAD